MIGKITPSLGRWKLAEKMRARRGKKMNKPPGSFQPFSIVELERSTVMVREKKRRVRNWEILKPLFWEYDLRSVRENLTSPFVIARVLELGDPQQVRAFTELLGEEAMKVFLCEKGEKLLSPQSLNFWKLYYRIQEDP